MCMSILASFLPALVFLAAGSYRSCTGLSKDTTLHSTMQTLVNRSPLLSTFKLNYLRLLKSGCQAGCRFD
jgi:hypothetical protein